VTEIGFRNSNLSKEGAIGRTPRSIKLRSPPTNKVQSGLAAADAAHAKQYNCLILTIGGFFLGQVMPPRCNRQLPTIKLSWFSARRRWATIHQDADEYDCHHLDAFCCHLRLHKIPQFGPDHRVFVLGPHSRLYFSASLCSLMELEYVPRKVRVPMPWLPHYCHFCVDIGGTRRPFEYVQEFECLPGRPRWEDITPNIIDNELSDDEPTEAQDGI
jgi:hypothetical protein